MSSVTDISAGEKGVEPFSEVLETAILPMNYTPVLVRRKPDYDIIAHLGLLVNYFLHFQLFFS